MAQFVRLESKGPIALLTLNRPPINALDETALQELAMAIHEVESDAAVRVAIITSGLRNVFCAGGDLKYWPNAYPRQAGVVSAAGRTIFAQIESLTKPSIAAINGPVIGDGLSLALACDIRLAAYEATFHLPEVGYGFIPGWGTIGRLVEAVGAALTAELLLVGEPMSASRAHAIGLVNRLTVLNELLPASQALAERIAAKPPRAIRYAKAALRGITDHPSSERAAWESRCFEAVWGGEEWERGIEALLA